MIVQGTTRGGASVIGVGVRRQRLERSRDEIAHVRVLHVADRRDDQVRRGVGATEVPPQRLGVQRFDGVFGAENRPARADGRPRNSR